MEKLRTIVTRADITFSAEWANSYGVFIQRWKIITKASVHVSYPMEQGRKPSREKWNETGCH